VTGRNNNNNDKNTKSWSGEKFNKFQAPCEEMERPAGSSGREDVPGHFRQCHVSCDAECFQEYEDKPANESNLPITMYAKYLSETAS
jgi:hypothetical protein